MAGQCWRAENVDTACRLCKIPGQAATIGLAASKQTGSMKALLTLLLLLLLGCAAAQNTPAEQTTAPPKNKENPTGATGTDTSVNAQSASDQENARKAKELVQKMIQALGGQAYLNMQDMSQQGRAYSFFHGQPNSVGTLFWRYYRYPDKDRVEVTKQRDVVYVHSGDKGYEITYKGTAQEDPKLTDEYNRRRDHSIEWIVRKWLNEPGIALFYEGNTVAADKPADQITILNTRNDSVTLYLDATSHLPIKKTFSWRDPTDKLRNTEDEVFDGYRNVQGIMTPFSVTRYENGDMSNQRFLHEVSYNTGIKDSLFDASITYDPNRLRKH